MVTPIWEKKLNENLTLYEFPDEPNCLHCTIHYFSEEYENTFAFGSWGCDRDEITVEDCLVCCQCMLCFDANVSISSFFSNLQYALQEIEDDEDEYE